MSRYRNMTNIEFQKVKAHTSEKEGGSKYNTLADKLSKIASKL